MKKTYGEFLEEKGSYRISSIPEAGSFEYILKNERLLLRLDQFGPFFMQMDPLGGMNILKRMERETFSPWKVLFSYNNRVFNNFDIYSSEKFSITYSPYGCEYSLSFDGFDVITRISTDSNKPEAFMRTEFLNTNGEKKSIRILCCSSFHPVDSLMDVWDKKEWMAKTSVACIDGYQCFKQHHLSLRGLPSDRRDIHYICRRDSEAQVTSYERLRDYTRNFNFIDSSVVPEVSDTYSFEQVCASYYSIELESSYQVSTLIAACGDDEIDPKKLIRHLDDSYIDARQNEIRTNYEKIINIKSVSTSDSSFNAFVNYFLPQELGWVVDLDRGWASGMRGTRDCSNDFMGYLSYDSVKCRNILKKLFESQRRSDGWFPRQIPFGSKKYDMREFVDSGCFVMEFVYEYLAYTDDYGLLDELFCYLDEPDVKESGLEHLLKAVGYYLSDENLGEHGLIKLRGGDWLDSLSKVGLKGRAETLMVTCQAVLAFKQVKEILNHVGITEYDSRLDFKAEDFRTCISACFNEKGYYNALFTDNGKWMFSTSDIDGHERAYIPANAFTIIAEIDESRNESVIRALKEHNRSDVGYKLISPPFGNPAFEGLGKLGSGDYFPHHLANGAVYNHGSQLFFLRALAMAGDVETFQDVLDFALPYNQDVHPESSTCLPMYAITNTYGLVPSFEGRAGFAFLTGTISMIERTIYNWMFGIDFRCDYIAVKPCIPKRFADSSVSVPFRNRRINVSFSGYGAHIRNAYVNGSPVKCSGEREILIDKNDCTEDMNIKIELY